MSMFISYDGYAVKKQHNNKKGPEQNIDISEKDCRLCYKDEIFHVVVLYEEIFYLRDSFALQFFPKKSAY